VQRYASEDKGGEALMFPGIMRGCVPRYETAEGQKKGRGYHRKVPSAGSDRQVLIERVGERKDRRVFRSGKQGGHQGSIPRAQWGHDRRGSPLPSHFHVEKAATAVPSLPEEVSLFWKKRGCRKARPPSRVIRGVVFSER